MKTRSNIKGHSSFIDHFTRQECKTSLTPFSLHHRNNNMKTNYLIEWSVAGEFRSLRKEAALQSGGVAADTASGSVQTPHLVPMMGLLCLRL